MKKILGLYENCPCVKVKAGQTLFKPVRGYLEEI